MVMICVYIIGIARTACGVESMHLSSVRPSVRPSVCMSVCPTRRLHAAAAGFML